MKIHLYSDTHGHPYIPKVEADVVVNAGDNERYEIEDIIQTPGNHDFYNNSNNIDDYDSYVNQNIMRRKDVIFLSCTLWTNFWGRDDLDDKWEGSEAHAYTTCLNDFHCIDGMTVDKMVELFNSDFEFLKEKVEEHKDKKIVIVTHFAPSKKSIHSKYEGNILNPYFANDLDDWILANPQIKLFCHGHTHCSLDYKIGDTRVVCNAMGYKNDDGSFENPDFNKDLIIEI